LGGDWHHDPQSTSEVAPNGLANYLWKLSYQKEKPETPSLFIFEAVTSETWNLHEWTISSGGEGAEYLESRAVEQLSSICG